MKKINKKNIFRNMGLSVMGAAIIGTGITVACHKDSNFEHSYDVCPICKYGNIPMPDTEYTIGIFHQMEMMKQEYNKKGYNVDIKYVPNYVDKRRERIEAYEVPDQDGNPSYFTKEGYSLVLDDGKYYGERYSFEIYNAIEVYVINDSGDKVLFDRLRLPQEPNLDTLNTENKLPFYEIELVKGDISLEEEKPQQVFTLNLSK